MDLLHLGRRGSASAAPGVTASGSGSGAGANNDDRHPYPTPSTSASFTSPEGSYELAYEVSPPVPATPATPGLAGAGSNPAAALAALNANPEHIPSLCVVSIRIPAAGSGGSGSGSGLLGLGGSQRGRAREASVSSTGGAAAGGLGAGITGQEYAGGFNASHDDQASSSNSASSYGGEASNSYPSNLPSLSPGPPSKRKALVSLPSMPSLPSVGLPGLGGGGANHGANAASNVTHKEQNAPTSKPKSAFRGTSSTFVKGYEGLPLSSRADKLWQSAEPRDVTLAVSTVGKSVLITDISPRAKSRDPIARLSFAAAPTSIAINQTTLSSDRIDIVVGFSTGDLLWMEVFSGRYTRYNKDASTPPSNNKVVGYVSSAAVKRLQWLAGDQVFVAGFADGCLAFYDKDRDDPSGFTPSQGLAPSAAPTGQQPSLLARMDSRLGLGVEGSAQTADPSTPGSYQEERDGMSKAGSRRLASYREAVEETTSDIVVTIPAANSEKKTAGKLNPLAHWKVSRKSITDFAISPDSAHCAVVSEDGCLRIIDCNSQRLLDTFQAYFGALTCVSWSPDGRFVLTGGQDDLACVWSPFEQRIVARCEGHSSFLTGLSFDAWRCDSRTQRFASVSEDCKLILWDLSSAALQRPKGHHHHHHHHGHHAPSQQHGPYGRRASASSALSLVRKRTIESNANLPLAYGVEREAPLWHRAPNRSEVPGLQPVTVKQISSELLAGIVFTSNMVVTLSRASTVKVFMRPEQRF